MDPTEKPKSRPKTGQQLKNSIAVGFSTQFALYIVLLNNMLHLFYLILATLAGLLVYLIEPFLLIPLVLVAVLVLLLPSKLLGDKNRQQRLQQGLDKLERLDGPKGLPRARLDAIQGADGETFEIALCVCPPLVPTYLCLDASRPEGPAALAAQEQSVGVELSTVFTPLQTSQVQQIHRALFRDHCWLEQGKLVTMLSVPRGQRISHVLRRVAKRRRQLQKTSQALASLADTGPSLLASALKTNSNWKQRVRLLQTLCEHHPGEQLTKKMCLGALHQGSPAEQIVASLYLGPEQLDAHLSLFGQLQLPADLWREAFVLARPHLTREQLVPVLEQGLLFPSADVVRGIVQEYQRLSLLPTVEQLALAVARTQNADLLSIFASLLGQVGTPLAESMLLDLLAQEQLEQAQGAYELTVIEVAASLRRIGTVVSVPALTHCKSRWVHSPFVQEAITSAVSEIQSRLTGEDGSLTLSDSENLGTLTVVEREGNLTMVPKK